jgi:DNA-binding CsgD family transcriptional regulator
MNENTSEHVWQAFSSSRTATGRLSTREPVGALQGTTRKEKPMTPQRHHHEGRAPAMSMPGLLLLGPQKDLIASNSEAIRILSYPGKPGKGRQLTALVADKIPLELVRAVPQGRTIAEFVSGRRRYICTGHPLDMAGLSKGTTAILLERVSSPEVTLYGISKKYNLTAREREAMGHLLRGLTSKEIAQEMGISPNTVKAFFRLVMTKMGVNTRAGLIGRVAGTTPADMPEYRDFEGTPGS